MIASTQRLAQLYTTLQSSYRTDILEDLLTSPKLQLGKIVIPTYNVRLHTNPVDLYLDYWTRNEMELLYC